MQHGAKTLLSVHPTFVLNFLVNLSSKQNLPSRVVLGNLDNLRGLSSALRQTGGCSGKVITGIKLEVKFLGVLIQR